MLILIGTLLMTRLDHVPAWRAQEAVGKSWSVSFLGVRLQWTSDSPGLMPS